MDADTKISGLGKKIKDPIAQLAQAYEGQLKYSLRMRASLQATIMVEADLVDALKKSDPSNPLISDEYRDSRRNEIFLLLYNNPEVRRCVEDLDL